MASWQSSSNSRSRLKGGFFDREVLAARCLQLVDFGILATIFIAPLFFGGRDDLGRMVFVVVASVTGSAWYTRQLLLNEQSKSPFSGAYLLAVAAIAVVVVQLIPLPWTWLQNLAPRNASIIPLWSAEAESSAQVGVWQSLSLTPSDTKLALATLIGYVLLFVTAVGRLRTTHEIQRLLRMMAIAGIAMAIFGLLQYFTSNGKFFWFYDYPYTDTSTRVKGSFTCSNHYVNYLVLCLGPLLACIVLSSPRHQSSRQRPWHSQTTSVDLPTILLYAGLLIVVFAIVLSKSRGGALALATSGAVCFGIYYLRGYVSSGQLLGLAVLGALVVGLLSLHGYNEVASRFDDFANGSVEELDRGGGRRRIWAANLAAIEQGGLFGSGAGSHREIYPTYLNESLELTYTHAENGYLQIATENGWSGIFLLSLAILMAISWCWKGNLAATSIEQKVLVGAVTAGVLASLVHSMVDFVWFIPACMSMTVLLLACALRLKQLGTQPENPVHLDVPNSQVAKFSFAAVALLSSAWACTTSIGPGSAAQHWNKYRLATASARKQLIDSLVTSNTEENASQQGSQHTEAMIFHLRNTLRCDPDSADAHSQLASKYLNLFEKRIKLSDNPMPVSQIRDAATRSQFATASELHAWLERACGEHRKLLYQSHFHTRRALELNPLDARAYLQLSDLCFLQGQSNSSTRAYIDQALLLRPYDSGVVFEVGEQLSVLGLDSEAINHWQRIFSNRGKHQLQIIQTLSLTMNVGLFLQLFEPDWHTLPYVWQHFHQNQGQLAGQAVVTYATKAAHHKTSDLSDKQAVAIWRSLAGMYKELSHLEGALYCYQHASRIAPTNYSARRELGRTLMQLNRFAEAEQHLQWCLTRRPHDQALKAEAIHAAQQQVARAPNREALQFTQ